MAAKSAPKSQLPKAASIFDFLNGMTIDKKPWDSFSDQDKKNFSPWMINRWLSMNHDITELVSVFQPFTIGILEPAETYKLYSGILPQARIKWRYIKGKKEDKYNPDLVACLKTYYEIGNEHIKTYIDILSKTAPGRDNLILILQKFGFEDKKINKIIKELS